MSAGTREVISQGPPAIHTASQALVLSKQIHGLWNWKYFWAWHFLASTSDLLSDQTLLLALASQLSFEALYT